MKTLILYKNPAMLKKDIYRDNYKKIGVYVWTQKDTGKKVCRFTHKFIAEVR
jgi:hypothetical protein